MRPNTLRRLRQIHLYIGMFFAPMLLLFAVSGALQTFRINEPRGYGGTPPAWMVWIAAIHKDQSAPHAGEHHEHHDDHDAGAAKPAQPPRAAPDGPSPLPLKIFTVLLAIGLFASTVIGMVIALNIRSARRGSLIALILGVVLPIVLLKL